MAADLFNYRSWKDPFSSEAHDSLPTDPSGIWDFLDRLWFKSAAYRNAAWRTLNYFITDLEVYGDKKGDPKEQQDFTERLRDEMGVLDWLRISGIEEAARGNSYATVIPGFVRYLVGKDTHGRFRDTSLEYCKRLGPVQFMPSHNTYKVVNPFSDAAVDRRSKVELPFVDRPTQQARDIRLTTLDPRDVTLGFGAWKMSTARVVWTPPTEMRTRCEDIQRGADYTSDIPDKILHAISGNQAFEFYTDRTVHVKRPQLENRLNPGFGVSQMLLNFGQYFHMEVLRSIDEAIGRDFMIPLRVMSPDPQHNAGNGMDVVGSDWAGWTGSMISQWRQDPRAIFSFPKPVVLQELGGNGKTLSPAEIVQAHRNIFLDDSGFPAELFSGSVNVDIIPTAIKMFEQTWAWLPQQLNRLVQLAADELAAVLQEPRRKVRLRDATIAADIENRQLYIQLAAAGELSRAKAYRSFGVADPVEEKTTRMEEDMELATKEREMQMQLEREQAGGLAPQGGPGAAPAGTAVTPVDAAENAYEQALQLLQTPIGERRKRMEQLRATDESTYSMVKQKMEEIRQQGSSAGRQNAVAVATGQ